MDLKDKELWMLSLLAELKVPAERDGVRRAGDLIDLAAAAYAEDEARSGLIRECANLANLCGLELATARSWGRFEAFVFVGGSDDRAAVFGYKGDSELEGLEQLFGGDAAVAEKAAEFVRANRGNGKLVVSGHSIGGAVAAYAAARTGCEGIVFDAPGIGKLLTDEPLAQIAVRNVLASNSFVSAIGLHPERLEFARSRREPEWGFYANPWHDKYMFDDAGNVIVGIKGELYELFAQLNRLSDSDSAIFEDVASAFADASDYKDLIIRRDAAVLLAVLERLEAGIASRAMADIEIRMCRSVDSKFASTSRKLRELAKIDLWTNEQAGLQEIEAKFKQLVENAMQQASLSVKDYMQAVETAMAVLAICCPGQGLEDEFEQALDRLVDTAEFKMREAARKIGDELEAAMETQWNRMMARYDLTLDW